MRGEDQLRYWEQETSKAVDLTLCLRRKLTGFQIAQIFSL